MNDGSLMALALGFVLVLGRTTGLFLALPLLSGELVPIGLRALVACALAAALLPGAGPAPQVGPGIGSLALAVGGELALGVVMGLTARLLLAAVEIAGDLAGMTMGLGFGQIIDPTSGEPDIVVRRLFGLAGGWIFFAVGGLTVMLRQLGSSFASMPPGSVVARAAWAEWVVDGVSGMMVTGVRLALPLVAVGLATQLVFGMLGRVAPQLNLWGVGFLISVGLGLVALLLFAPLLVDELRALFDEGLGSLGSW